MKVLSIDLDYIMGPSIDLYQSEFWNDCAHWRWEDFFENSDIKENELEIDPSNLLFCYKLFLRAIKESECEVTFAYDHDNILYELQDLKNIDLINIDHHHDILYHDSEDDDGISDSLEKKYQAICNYSMINEGNWVAWLQSKNKINSYTWVGNENSFESLEEETKNYCNSLIPNFNMKTKENFELKDYKFDYIFICLSPQYTPKIYWHYFSMFVEAYQQITGNDVDLSETTTKKYETFIRHSAVTDEILY